MILGEKPPSCLNWNLICKKKFPQQLTELNVEEDFNLLFQESIDPIKLKDTLRSSIREPNQAVRKFLWKRILLNDPSQALLTIEKYNKKISLLFGKNLTLKAELPDFVDREHLTYYFLNDEGIGAVSRLLNVLASSHPEIIFAPLLLPLASLFLHYMSEAECYACILSVVESNNKITQTDIHWTTTNNVFRRFAQKYAHAAYEYLLETLYKHTSNPDVCFEVIDNWQWWIFEYLPFSYVLNIVDSFLLEGQKVLYRFGISILDHFYKSLSIPRPTMLKPNCIKEFCNRIAIPYERLIKTAFGFRNMSKKDIENVFQTEEKAIKKLRVKTSQENFMASMSEHSKPSDESKSSQKVESDYKRKLFSTIISPFIKQPIMESEKSQSTTTSPVAVASSRNSIQWTSPIKLRQNKKWYLNAVHGSTHSFHHHAQSNLNLPSFSVENTGSNILSPQQIALLWRWLPTRYQILELQLIYSTNIHGCRLMTLMDKIEFYQATIIVVQTLTNSVFGAFCSQPWSNRVSSSRRPAYFGNGETFLFELLPNTEKYEWVGKSKNGQTTANQEMFLYADHEKLIVGGGHEKGIGLVINSDLISGRTAVSDTFENRILGSEQEFEIAVLEVFSFNSS